MMQSTPLEPRAALAVVIHDVAPATLAACEQLQRCVQAVAPLPTTLLAVPRYHGQALNTGFENALDAALAEGHELALHGYTHWDAGSPRGIVDRFKRRVYTAGEGEFAALSVDEAAQRLRAGRRWFARNGWPLAGFVAPAWLLGAGCWQALHASGLQYTCTLRGLVDLRRRRVLASQAIVYSTRAAWRRALSLPWNAAVARAQQARPLLRFELHPADAEHAQVRRAWMRLLERALGGRDALTLSQALARWRHSDRDQGQAASNKPAVASPVSAPANTSLG